MDDEHQDQLFEVRHSYCAQFDALIMCLMVMPPGCPVQCCLRQLDLETDISDEAQCARPVVEQGLKQSIVASSH